MMISFFGSNSQSLLLRCYCAFPI